MEAQAAALARALSVADADAQLRRALLRCKCEELERVLRELTGRAARRRGQRAAEIGQSIQDAVDRARNAREGRARGESDAGGGDEGASDGELQVVLEMARAVREVQPASGAPSSSDAAAAAEAAAAAAATAGSPPARAPRLRVEVPRRLKTLVERLEDKRAEPFRLAFRCKVGEHLSLSAARRRALAAAVGGERTRLDAPVARIQVSFPKQAERLARAYARLSTFVGDKLAADAAEIQAALRAPSLPRLLPLCARLRLAKQMQRLLDSEAEELRRRAPPRPALSTNAIAHRDAVLARIRRKRRPADATAGAATLSNAPLLEAEVLRASDRGLLDSLQDAWAAGAGSPTAYQARLRELVLNEASSLILAAFKQLFVCSELPPRDGDVESMMRLVRLVDSIALTRGRRYRSIIAPSID